MFNMHVPAVATVYMVCCLVIDLILVVRAPSSQAVGGQRHAVYSGMCVMCVCSDVKRLFDLSDMHLSYSCVLL